MIFLNKDRFLRLLIELFSKYESMITLHSAVISELLAVLKGAGVEGQFLSKLEEYLFNLNSYGDDAIKGNGAPRRRSSALFDAFSIYVIQRSDPVRLSGGAPLLIGCFL